MLARNLSGGTKQKLALVCAISHNPRVLFLDELTAGIDPLSSREVWFMLYEFTKKGITIFVNTHMMNEAEHCNRLSFIFKGKIMATGSPQQLKTEYIKEKMLELSSKVPLIKIIGDFQKLSSILDVYTSGEFLHLTTKDEAAAKKQINDYARAKGYAFTIREISPSLEDVFVNLTRDLER